MVGRVGGRACDIHLEIVRDISQAHFLPTQRVFVFLKILSHHSRAQSMCNVRAESGVDLIGRCTQTSPLAAAATHVW